MSLILRLATWSSVICMAAAAAVVTGNDATSHWCNSPIYCEGPLLKAVQLARLYPDSKTFVDMPTSRPVDQVLQSFEQISNNATTESIQKFVEDNFFPAGRDLAPVNVSIQPLSWLDEIDNLVYRSWADFLHHAWAGLAFRFDTSFLCDGCTSSSLPVQRPFVVPGGRFREFYYWDSFFVIEGLLLSDLDDLAKGMIENFMDFVETYGFIPNGARIYYLNRSQPPFLTEMVKQYYEKTKDKDLLKRAVPLIEKEYNFWMQNTSVGIEDSEGKNYTLNRYYVDNSSPRPESYVEDYTTAYNGTHLNREEIDDLFANLATGAETGWDYSSRWTRLREGQPNDILRSLNTRNIVPVDLNSLMWSIENTLSDWYDELSRSSTKLSSSADRVLVAKSRYYNKQAKRRLEAIEALLWNDQHSAYYDYNLTSHHQNVEFTPAGMYPIWLGALPERVMQNRTSLTHLFDQVKLSLDQYPGLLTTSNYNTSMQWDWPNGWPPLQYITLQAMKRVQAILQSAEESKPIETLANDLAQRNVASAFCAWYKTGGSIPNVLQKLPDTADQGHMFEKFDVRHVGGSGFGGEYKVQVGFGWTNGVILWIFRHFANMAPVSCT